MIPSIAPDPQIVTVFNFFYGVARGVAGLFMVWYLILAGFYFLTSGGDPQAIARSKSAGYNAVVGFVIVVLASAVGGWIQRGLGM